GEAVKDLKTLIPAEGIALAKLLRTAATLRGVHDGAERANRLSAVGRMRSQPAAPRSGRRILVFSFRGWYPHIAWESVIAHALRLRGHDVHVFNCGGTLPVCEMNFRHTSPALTCAECSMYPGELVRSLGLARSWLRDYVSQEEINSIRAAVGRLKPAD